MRQDNSPWNKSYNYLKHARRREEKRSEAQQESKKRWSEGFFLTKAIRGPQTPIGPDFHDTRKKVDEYLEDRRNADELKEIWE